MSTPRSPKYDPACDQCRKKKTRCGREHPSCNNCQRSGLICDFSERGKRPSQGRLIVGSLDKINQCLEGVDTRLAGVEDAVSQLCNMMIQFMSILEVKEKGHGGKIEGRNGRSEFRKIPPVFDKQYYGSSSLSSLIGKIISSLQDFVEDSCMYDGSDGTGEGSLQECMTIMDGMANSLLMDQCLDQLPDSRPLVLPPRKLLDAAVGIYFDRINRMLPLFDKDAFTENIRRSYELGPDAGSAWILCFNGIILITLNIRALGSSKMAQDRESTTVDDTLKEDLIKQFHANFRGGLNKPQSLLEPSLINVQALLLMCSIAQENFQGRLSSLFLHQACFVAKSIGLHKKDAMPTKQSKGEALERNYVFWALYVTDKMISINLGISCCLPSFDCDVDLPGNDASNPFLKHLVARIELACIQEDTYQSLYSSQACRRNQAERDAEIARLDRDLSVWMSNNKKLCANWVASIDGPTWNSFHPNIALSYFFYSSQILVHRAGNEDSDQDRCRKIARACLQIFARLDRESTSIESAVVSRQILRDHPLFPFFVLFANVIQDPASEDSAQDLHLMLLVTDVLQHIEQSAEDRSYIPQFLLVASSCCEAAGALIRKPSMLSSPTSTQSYGISGAVPSSTYGATHGNTEPWSLGSSGQCTDITSGSPTCVVPGSSPLDKGLDPFEVRENWASEFFTNFYGNRAPGPGHDYSIHGTNQTIFGTKDPRTTQISELNRTMPKVPDNEVKRHECVMEEGSICS